ncbi:calcium-binding protein [Nostoc foliaceum]|uniref:Uncharacterized protein n=1 Tax=Nostoc foliaceum FACHB-393 TaxID=2692915 RepID=A0ABR8IJN1_9NOSO|nr:calcium-binding protein [Nostoc foliaceum]MBD2651785.1 hypothetical protein [Nostoc foliaceum FACHB-393]
MKSKLFFDNLISELDLSGIYGIVNVARNNVYSYLSSFRNDAGYTDKLETAFGNDFDREVANQLFDSFAQGNFSNIPSIKIVKRDDINGANGAFSRETNLIYLASEFITENANNPQAITDVLLEETGHFVDAQINTNDAAGDEGDIFARLVQGKSLSQQELAVLQVEDDTTTVTLDGQVIQIEMNVTGASKQWLWWIDNAGDGDGYMQGSNEDEWIGGRGGNDVIKGGGGSDRILGEGGNDTLNPAYSQGSSDTVDGGTGDDLLQVDYTNKINGAGIHLGWLGDNIYSRGGAGDNPNLVSFSNIERFEITGTKYDDVFDRLGGNDIFNGGEGNDVLKPLYSQGSSDTVDGGAGDDLLQVDYTNKINGAGIHLGFNNTNKIHSRGGAGDNFELVDFSNIERFNIIGTKYNDVFEDRGGNDIFKGGDGNDVLKLLYSQGSSDTVDGGAGDDLLQVDYTNKINGAGIHLGFDLGNGNGNTNKIHSRGGAGDNFELVDFSNIERFNIIGTKYDDVFEDRGGNGVFNGGDGNDTFVASKSASSYVVRLDGQNQGSVSSGITNKQLFSIENVIGSNSNDSLYGDGQANHLQGNDGSDLLEGGSGNDILSGGLGNDTLKGGLGDDTLTGGKETNNLWGGEGQDTFVTESGGVQVIKDFERGVDKIDMAQAQVSQISFDISTIAGSTIIKVNGTERARVEGSLVDSYSLINTSEDINSQPLSSEEVKNLSTILQKWAENYAQSLGLSTNVYLVNNKLQMVRGDLEFM